MLIAVSTDGRPPCSIDVARSGGHDSAISATSIGNSCRLGSPARRKLASFYRGFRGIPDMKGLVLFFAAAAAMAASLGAPSPDLRFLLKLLACAGGRAYHPPITHLSRTRLGQNVRRRREP